MRNRSKETFISPIYHEIDLRHSDKLDSPKKVSIDSELQWFFVCANEMWAILSVTLLIMALPIWT